MTRTDTDTDTQQSRGTIVLAAYKPDPDLFARQLTSLQNQTLTDFDCIISADGEHQAVQQLTSAIVGDDDRFRVVGFDDRLGFYRNFERGLAHVPSDAAWVALSDQDDLWHEHKLETLVPHLRTHTMVSGQARVVEYPSGRVIHSSTGRRTASALDVMAINQFSGAMSVFRREVLDLALPFPGMAVRTEVHDHWLAVCAALLGPTMIVDEALQDYVQHGGNVIGEADAAEGRIRLTAAWSTLTAASRRVTGSATPTALVRTLRDMGFGWRRAMTMTLESRLPADTADLAELRRAFGSEATLRNALPYLSRTRTHGASNAAMLTAGRLLSGRASGWRR